LLGDWAADAEAAHAARLAGVARGPVTGLMRLDRELGGYLAPGLHFLMAEPGTGKTALALQVAGTCGTPAVYVSAEMAPLELMRRVTARVTGTFLGRLKSGELTPAASLELARQAAYACPMLALVDATLCPVAPWREPGRDEAPPGMLELAETWRDRHKARSVLIVVDSLHSWSDGSGRAAASEYEALNAAIVELRGLAARLEAPVLAISEQNRGAMGTGKQSAGAGTRKLEYQGSTVLSLQREVREGTEWQEDAAGEYAVSCKLAKNRNGRTGPSVSLRFHGATQTFREA
jgi:replicative DNA helicase